VTLTEDVLVVHTISQIDEQLFTRITGKARRVPQDIVPELRRHHSDLAIGDRPFASLTFLQQRKQKFIQQYFLQLLEKTLLILFYPQVCLLGIYTSFDRTGNPLLQPSRAGCITLRREGVFAF
jgi:hypothetical protein